MLTLIDKYSETKHMLTIIDKYSNKTYVTLTNTNKTYVNNH